MLDIDDLMSGLSRRRPLFHSEADFQHELAWEIRATIDGCPARLEFPPFPDNDKRMALDIWLPSVGTAIELKYCTRKFERSVLGGRFSLANQLARDIKRYDFLNDIQRIERVVMDYETANCGLAVLLTNDPLFWEQQSRADVVDAEFHIPDGQRIGLNEMSWGDNASDGTKRSREKPITLSHSYVLKWHDYSALGDKRGERFRYLAVAVPPAKE